MSSRLLQKVLTQASVKPLIPGAEFGFMTGRISRNWLLRVSNSVSLMLLVPVFSWFNSSFRDSIIQLLCFFSLFLLCVLGRYINPQRCHRSWFPFLFCLRVPHVIVSSITFLYMLLVGRLVVFLQSWAENQGEPRRSRNKQDI